MVPLAAIWMPAPISAIWAARSNTVASMPWCLQGERGGRSTDAAADDDDLHGRSVYLS